MHTITRITIRMGAGWLTLAILLCEILVPPYKSLIISPFHIIVTGPESSGKSQLSLKLAKSLPCLLVPEYARGYLEALNRKAERSDFAHLAVATQQLVAAAKAQLAKHSTSQTNQVLVQDTGFEILKLWMDDKFHEASAEVQLAFETQKPDLYLLCRPDLPWQPDPLREDAHRRDELFNTLKFLLISTGVDVQEMTGFGESRYTIINSLKIKLSS